LRRSFFFFPYDVACAINVLRLRRFRHPHSASLPPPHHQRFASLPSPSHSLPLPCLLENRSLAARHGLQNVARREGLQMRMWKMRLLPRNLDHYIFLGPQTEQTDYWTGLSRTLKTATNYSPTRHRMPERKIADVGPRRT
jgi:hypothetical protein